MSEPSQHAPASTAIDICAELDRFRQKLLDLSNTNRLLNYRKSWTRTIQVVDELPNQIFDRLVLKEKSFAFLPTEASVKGSLFPADDSEPASDADVAPRELAERPIANALGDKRYADDKLQTNLTEQRLEPVLNKMRQEANAGIEETGVNYLFLALGMLEWREREGSDRVFQSPLILVPVRLDRSFDGRAAKYRTTLSFTREDIQPNLCLARRIEDDFGLVVPEYEPDEDGSYVLPEDYFSRVGDAIAKKTEWRIKRESLIGFFSFRKLLMYLDLDPNKWKGGKSPNNHPLVRAVIEGSRLDQAPDFVGKDYDIDEHKTAKQITLVRDADSSQHSALCDIADGRSLVIEGPPGTGKSQTITNAIANAIGQGKSVLFVAEKLPALKVVLSNLDKVGLGVFCLSLHSEAANSKDVFADLGRRLEHEVAPPSNLESLRLRIESKTSKLKKYLVACGSAAGPHRKPLYEVFWRIAELRSRGVEPLGGSTLDTSIDELQFDEVTASLGELAAHAQELSAPNESPWCGFIANGLTPSGHRMVAETLRELVTLASQILDGCTDLQARYGGDVRSWMVLAGQLTEAHVREMGVPVDFDRNLLPFLANSDQCKIAVEAVKAVSDMRNVLRRTAQLVVGELGDARATATELVVESQTIPRTLRDLTVAKTRDVRSHSDTAIHTLQTVESLATTLTTMGFGEIRTLRDFESALYKYRLVSHAAVTPPHSIIEPQFLAGAKEAFKRGTKTATALQQQRASLDAHVYVAKVPADDVLENVVDILKAYGHSWTKFFRLEYWKAKKCLASFARPTARRNSDGVWVKILTELRQLERGPREFANDAELKQYFGPCFLGTDTDWESLKVTLDWINTAKIAGVGFQQAVALVNSRWENTTAPAESNLITACKDLRHDLGQPEIARVLGVNSEKMKDVLLAGIRTALIELSRLIGRIHDLRSAFTVGDSATVDQLCGQAAQVVETLGHVDQLRTNATFGRAFPQHFFGITTDVSTLAATAQWLLKVDELGLVGESIRRAAADEVGEEVKVLTSQIDRIRGLLQSWNETRTRLSAFGTLASSWLALPGPATDIALIEFLQTLQNDLPHLPPWSGVCRALDQCKRLGMQGFADAIYKGTINVDVAAACFDLTLHEQLATEILQASEPLSSFSRHAVDQVRAEFQELDRELIRANQQAIAYRASKRSAPYGNAVGRVGELTELGLIRHEIGKQRRHCRIRDLVARAGHAVQALKPCLMMSPLSISQYLPAGSVEFDLVVMDEASQIKPEDALGTLIRAKQIVIVGDPKQLPPTSFFDRIAEEDDGDESTFLDDSESILEVSMKAFPHKRRLRWHYRSQHESLIAFSNEKFYEGDLVVFPSPTSAAGSLGLRWHAIENASFEGGCNPVEANAVAEAIIRHAIEHPNETLGVVAFNARQAQAIEDRRDALASASSEARLALDRLNEHSDRLFIKNLESVQGDERDVIFISYTYGRDPATKVVMNRFGPITGENGWRRLNVLITRAKKRVEIFSSMTPGDIKGGVDRSRGVNAMKDYLHYAMTGQLVDRGSPSGRDPDSPFEISVARVVERMGLKVVPQVGVAGYFVDLGVLKPDSVSEFLLGIECDGASYHSSKSARDRDRLREEVIILRGWRLHRIWSTDWFLNQEAEEERLRAAINRELGRQTA